MLVGVGISLLKDADTLQRWNVIMAGNLLLVLPMLGLYVAAARRSATPLYIPVSNKNILRFKMDIPIFGKTTCRSSLPLVM